MKLSIKFDDIDLKPVSPNCISRGWLNWVNDPKLNQYLSQKKTSTKQDLIDYLNKDHIIFLACYHRKKYFANIRVYSLSKKNRVFSFGRLIGDIHYRDKKYGIKLVRLAMKISFEWFNCNKLIVGNHTNNIASRRSKLKNGFKKITLKSIKKFNLKRSTKYEYFSINKNTYFRKFIS